MASIVATGLLVGRMTEVECHLEDGQPVFTIDGDVVDSFDDTMQKLLENPPPFGGTYFPPSDSLLAALSVLKSRLFDQGSDVKIEVDGDIGTIPIYDEVPDAIY